MSSGLVSVITPCYNAGHLVHRLFDSILSQTYPRIEVIAVNDGSTDNTAEVIQSYYSKFDEKGYKLIMLSQDNQGMAVAINNALKHVKGDFIVWPDSDDFYDADYTIEKMVAALTEASSEFAVVRIIKRVVDEVTMQEIQRSGSNAKFCEDRLLFEDCLFIQNGFYFCAGAYMVRANALREQTLMNIYTHKDTGQNWQLLLPVLYKYRCLTLKSILYNVVARMDSHSRSDNSVYERELRRTKVYELTVLNTLDRIKEMPESDVKDYKSKIKIKYSKERLDLAYSYRRRDDFLLEYSKFACMQKKGLSGKLRLRYFAVRTHTEGLLDLLFSIKRRIL